MEQISAQLYSLSYLSWKKYPTGKQLRIPSQFPSTGVTWLLYGAQKSTSKNILTA